MGKIDSGAVPPPGGGNKPSVPVGPTKPFELKPGTPKTIPSNLGELMKKYPKIGEQFYKSLILGIAMKMMKEMRKQAKLKKE